MINYCKCGCGEIISPFNTYKNSHVIRVKHPMMSIEARNKVRNSMIRGGSKKANIYNHTKEINEKRRKKMIDGHAIYMNSFNHTEDINRKQKERMKNGLALYINTFITNPSKPQVSLFELVKQLCYCAVINYGILEINRIADIAIPFHKIAIEYDEPYWHNKQKDKERDKLFESIGWKVIRYECIVPSLEELKENIENEILR